MKSVFAEVLVSSKTVTRQEREEGRERAGEHTKKATRVRTHAQKTKYGGLYLYITPFFYKTANRARGVAKGDTPIWYS